MTHESWVAQLDSYLDGELATIAMDKLDAHLRGCPECAAESLRRLQWKKMVHSAGQRYRADSALRERVRTNVAGKRLGPNWWRWTAMAAAVAALLVVGGVRFLENGSRLSWQNRVVSELVDLHVSTLASATPVDVVSTDRHTVKPWFAGKIPFTFNLPELQGSAFELIGGRMSYLEQAPGAELIFRIRKHQISVFIFQDRAVWPEFPTSQEFESQAFHLESWRQGELRYFAVGDAGAEDLRALRGLLENAK